MKTIHNNANKMLIIHHNTIELILTFNFILEFQSITFKSGHFKMTISKLSYEWTLKLSTSKRTRVQIPKVKVGKICGFRIVQRPK